MPGSLSICPLTEEQAERIIERQRIVNKGTLYTVGAAVLALAAESIYRNLGGDPEVASYIFQAGGYTLLASGVVATLNNRETVTRLDDGPKKSLESKVSE